MFSSQVQLYDNLFNQMKMTIIMKNRHHLFIGLLTALFCVKISHAQQMNVKPGTKITVETNTQLNLTGGYNLVLESDETGDASFIDLGTVNYDGGGEAKVQRYVTPSAWHLIASPITSATAGMFVDDYLQYHTESTNIYTDITSADYQLVPGQGYSYWSTAQNPTVEVFEGISNTGDVQFNFTKFSQGYNLMGNPYPSAIDWDEVTIPTGLNGHFQLWNPAGFYVYYIKNGGETNTTSQYIPSGQGFFTQATTAGTLTLTNSSRTHADQDFYKSENAEPLVVLKVTGHDITTQTAVRFIEESTAGVDRDFDVPLIVTYYPEVPFLYSMSENIKMATNTLPSIKQHETIPLTFESVSDGTYQVDAMATESIPENYEVLLEDVSQNYFQDLRENPSYEFGYAAGNTKAFKLHFKDVTSVEELVGANANRLQVQCYLVDGMLYVNFPGEQTGFMHADISVFTVTGQKVLHKSTCQNTNEIPFRGNTAIYMVNIQSGKRVYSTKVFNQ